MANKIIVVTGATGTVGSRIVNNLVARKREQVVAFVRDPQKAVQLASAGATLRRGTFEDQASLREAFTGADTLVLAACHVVCRRLRGYALALPLLDQRVPQEESCSIRLALRRAHRAPAARVDRGSVTPTCRMRRPAALRADFPLRCQVSIEVRAFLRHTPGVTPAHWRNAWLNEASDAYPVISEAFASVAPARSRIVAFCMRRRVR